MTKEEYDTKEKAIQAQIGALKAELESLKQERMRSITDIRVNDIIEDDNRRGVVRKVDWWLSDSVIFKVAFFTKKGVPSKVWTRVYSEYKPVKIGIYEEEC